MKHLILFLYLCMFSFLNITYAQCTCSISSGTAQYPLTTLTPTTNWASQADIWAGDYTLFNVVSGNTYTWSYCSLDGGSSTWDTRLNLYRESNSTYITCSGDYDVSACGNAAKIVWTANFNGVVRLITNVYINSSNQCGANTTGAKLRYKLSVQSLPDLIIEEFPTLSSSTVPVGGNTTVYFKVMNQGTANAGSSITSIHISSKSWYDGTATYVDEYATSSISTGSNSGSKSKSITLPSSITPGNYYILVSADGGPPYPGGAVSESNENNQTTYVQLTVTQSCNYTLSSYSKNFTSESGGDFFFINTSFSCSWLATSNESWISTISASSGPGTILYDVEENEGSSPRTGYITVGSKTFTVTQDGKQNNSATVSGFVSSTTGYVGDIFTWTANVSGNIGSGVSVDILITNPITNKEEPIVMTEVSSKKFTYSGVLSAIGTYKFRFRIPPGNTSQYYSGPTTTVRTPTDDYPPSYLNPNCKSTDLYEVWGFARSTCTSWVAWKINQANGVTNLSLPSEQYPFYNTMLGGRFGNASNWKQNAIELNNAYNNIYPVNQSPAVGSIAWYGPFEAGPGSSSGHVAYVVAYNDPMLTVTEYNVIPCEYGTRTIDMSADNGTLNRKPSWFIHIEGGAGGSGGVTSTRKVSAFITALQAFPNPSAGAFNLTFYSEREDQTEIFLIDLMGTVVHQEYFEAQKGGNSKEIHTETLPNGIYIIGVKNRTRIIQKRIIIQH